jgi:hypothetical protein
VKKIIFSLIFLPILSHHSIKSGAQEEPPTKRKPVPPLDIKKAYPFMQSELTPESNFLVSDQRIQSMYFELITILDQALPAKAASNISDEESQYSIMRFALLCTIDPQWFKGISRKMDIDYESMERGLLMRKVISELDAEYDDQEYNWRHIATEHAQRFGDKRAIKLLEQEEDGVEYSDHLDLE